MADSGNVSGPEGDVQRFATGAVRGTDAMGTRFDLLSLQALRSVADWAQAREALPEQGPGEIGLGPCAFACMAFGAALEASWADTRFGFFQKAREAAYHALCAAHKARGGYFDPGRPFDGQPGNRGHRPRYELLPPLGVQAYAEAMREGSIKYSPFNWLAGFPVWDLLNHALRHYSRWFDGDTSEDHLGHAVWNLMATVHFAIERPELADGMLWRMPKGSAAAIEEEEDDLDSDDDDDDDEEDDDDDEETRLGDLVRVDGTTGRSWKFVVERDADRAKARPKGWKVENVCGVRRLYEPGYFAQKSIEAEWSGADKQVKGRTEDGRRSIFAGYGLGTIRAHWTLSENGRRYEEPLEGPHRAVDIQKPGIDLLGTLSKEFQVPLPDGWVLIQSKPALDWVGGKNSLLYSERHEVCEKLLALPTATLTFDGRSTPYLVHPKP